MLTFAPKTAFLHQHVREYYEEKLNVFVRANPLPTDPWGSPLEWIRRVDYSRPSTFEGQMSIWSHGPDRTRLTVDDIVYPRD